MSLKLYDTLSREIREVFAMDGKAVRFYGCGPTVYGPAHIGNFRTFVMQDVFRRVLETSGQKTYHVRNLTDVDDKTIRQSQTQGLELQEFTRRWTQRFHDDCLALNLLNPHAEPSAVSHIPEQIILIQRLIQNRKAYLARDGSVYFNVGSFENYGSLSKLADRKITTTNASREFSDEYDKDSAADFALWKSRRPEDGDNYWDSPWGQGRPGWHIECSAICLKHLGDSFDLHSGGVDLVFPHHENEIAQVESVTEKPFARHWFHIAHLLVEGKKMSKSLGNLHTLEDLKALNFHPPEIRYLLLSGSYRQPLNFTFDSLNSASKAMSKIRDFAQKISYDEENFDEYDYEFGPFHGVQEALQKDLNTPDALGRFFVSMRKQSESMLRGEFSKDSSQMNELRMGFHAVCTAFGFVMRSGLDQESNVPEKISRLAEKRWQAKQKKDWATADKLRMELLEAGWAVKDSKDGFHLTHSSLSNNR